MVGQSSWMDEWMDGWMGKCTVDGWWMCTSELPPKILSYQRKKKAGYSNIHTLCNVILYGFDFR